MLKMTALEFSYPVLFLIKVKATDTALHGGDR